VFRPLNHLGREREDCQIRGTRVISLLGFFEIVAEDTGYAIGW